MASYLRLRQICLAAPRLDALVDDLTHIFEVEVCYRDPNVARYGLQNALIPFGTDFLEIVSPTQADTAAGRFISRTRGHGGYMAIFQTDNPRQRQQHAQSLGVRTAHEIERDAYQSVQLHPRDCRAAFIELGHSTGGEDRMATWWPAGERWQQFVRTGSTRRMLGIELESPDPAGLARHWANILQTPLTGGATPQLRFDDMSVGFVAGRTDCLGAILVQCADPAATMERAIARGCRVDDGAFHLGGVDFKVKA